MAKIIAGERSGLIQLKRLRECTLDEAVAAWNSGFAGYYVDVSTTADKFLNRMYREDLSASLSIVAWVDGKPAGLVMNGVRTIGGQKVAWNGGTCVVPELRGRGVGAAMIEAVMELYRQAGVERAVLEAFVQNEPAISLYRKMGYQLVDRLLFLERTDPFADRPFAHRLPHRYTLRSVRPHEVGRLPFYRSAAPWQTQWQSAKEGEALIALDPAGEAVGYALYERVYEESGAIKNISLLQCEARPELAEADEVLRIMLAELFAPHDVSCRRSTFNLPASRQRLLRLLAAEGFQPKVEQVYLEKQMDKSDAAVL